MQRNVLELTERQAGDVVDSQKRAGLRRGGERAGLSLDAILCNAGINGLASGASLAFGLFGF